MNLNLDIYNLLLEMTNFSGNEKKKIGDDMHLLIFDD